jgi:hypothetical protein
MDFKTLIKRGKRIDKKNRLYMYFTPNSFSVRALNTALEVHVWRTLNQAKKVISENDVSYGVEVEEILNDEKPAFLYLDEGFRFVTPMPFLGPDHRLYTVFKIETPRFRMGRSGIEVVIWDPAHAERWNKISFLFPFLVPPEGASVIELLKRNKKVLYESMLILLNSQGWSQFDGLIEHLRHLLELKDGLYERYSKPVTFPDLKTSHMLRRHLKERILTTNLIETLEFE